jgi:uncharacterized protein (TIGR02722 family)
MGTHISLVDVSTMARSMVGSMLSSPALASVTQVSRPIVLVDRVQNSTDQHFDTQSLTDSIRTQLIQSGRFRFTDKSSREAQKEEIDYQHLGGMIGQDSAVSKGRQLGAQYLLWGRIVSYEERSRDIVRKSYKLTLNLINLDTGIIEWADEKPITKVQSRSTFGR